MQKEEIVQKMKEAKMKTVYHRWETLQEVEAIVQARKVGQNQHHGSQLHSDGEEEESQKVIGM